MDKPNGTSTGDKNTGQNLAPSDRANTVRSGQHNFESGDKFSHPGEHHQQQVATTLTRCETQRQQAVSGGGGYYEPVGLVGGNQQLKPPNEPYSNDSRRPQWNEQPTARAARSTPESPTAAPSRWFEWAHTFGDGLKSNSFESDCHEQIASDGIAQDSSQQEKATGRLKQFFKMAQSHYLISILCLVLVVVACLTASFVISRAIGDLDVATDTTRDGAGQQLRQALVSPLEVRTIELVDLMESGKTFAYVRWRVKVMLPKSSAIYKQHPVTNASHLNLVAETGTRADSSLANDQTLNMDTDHQREKSPLAETNLQQQQKQQQQQQQAASPNSDMLLNLATDPIELAASELSVKAEDMNSTLVDCFLVDTDKRIEQKRVVEARHIAEAITRRVNFKNMLTIIQACRILTLSSLPPPSQFPNVQPLSSSSSPLPQIETMSPVSPEHDRGPIAKPAPIPPLQPRLETAGIHQQNQLSHRKSNALDEVIVPVERTVVKRRPLATEPPAASHDVNPLGLLFDTLITALTRPSSTANTANNNNNEAGSSYETTRGKRDVPMQTQPGDNRRPMESGRAVPSTKVSDNKLIDPSSNQDDEARRASYVSMGMSMMSGIVPNTLWCGLGDRARNYSELGSEFQIDACCRAHDHCPIRLKPFSSDYQLINWSMSTRSHCECDLDFNDCLTAINSTLSNVIKALYFRFVGLQCIDLEGRSNRNQPGEVSSSDVLGEIVS